MLSPQKNNYTTDTVVGSLKGHCVIFVMANCVLFSCKSLWAMIEFVECKGVCPSVHQACCGEKI